MPDQQRTVNASTVLQWWEKVEEHRRHNAYDLRARALDNALYWVCRGNGAIRVESGDDAPSPAGDRTFWIESGPDAHFDWTNGEIVFRQEVIEGALTPDQLIAQLEEYTGITEHAADAST